MLLFLKDHLVPHAGNDHHPHLLRHRGLIGTSAILFAIKGTALFLPLAFPDVTYADEGKLSITPQTIIELSNVVRASNGLLPLVEDPDLDEAAQAKADDMAAKGYFSHTSPDGTNALDRMIQSGYPVRYAAENLAIHFFTAEDVQRGWMESPSHRAILLDKRYEDSGIGVANGMFEGQMTTYVVHLFGRKTDTSMTGVVPTIVTNTQVASTYVPPKEKGAARVLAQTFSRPSVEGATRKIYLYIIAFLTGILLLTFTIRFRARHVASLPHAMLVISLAIVLMLA
jgi:hypothetical protein